MFTIDFTSDEVNRASRGPWNRVQMPRQILSVEQIIITVVTDYNQWAKKRIFSLATFYCINWRRFSWGIIAHSSISQWDNMAFSVIQSLPLKNISNVHDFYILVKEIKRTHPIHSPWSRITLQNYYNSFGSSQL